MSATRVAVLRFPGTLDHESATRAVEGVGGEPVYAHHEDTALPDGTGAVVIPGGFSYGDHLRPGALASRTPIMGAVRAHAADGGKVTVIHDSPGFIAQRVIATIVNISSGRFWNGTPNRLHYSTSKAGVIGLTRSLAREIGPDNITVNAISGTP